MHDIRIEIAAGQDEIQIHAVGRGHSAVNRIIRTGDKMQRIAVIINSCQRNGTDGGRIARSVIRIECHRPERIICKLRNILAAARCGAGNAQNRDSRFIGLAAGQALDDAVGCPLLQRDRRNRGACEIENAAGCYAAVAADDLRRCVS